MHVGGSCFEGEGQSVILDSAKNYGPGQCALRLNLSQLFLNTVSTGRQSLSTLESEELTAAADHRTSGRGHPSKTIGLFHIHAVYYIRIRHARQNLEKFLR